MTLENLTLDGVKALEKLVKLKEKLTSQLELVNTKLSSFGQRSIVLPSSRRRTLVEKSARSAGARRRGSVRESIIAALKAAGPGGLHVTELARRTGSTRGSISVWFSSNAKKLKNLKKVKNATWSWDGK